MPFKVQVYDFVHVRRSNEDKLLGVEFCLLWMLLLQVRAFGNAKSLLNEREGAQMQMQRAAG